jgi:hypothetical protein
MAMAVILEPLNVTLAHPDRQEYVDAEAVVAEATSCREAVEQLGVLTAFPPDVAREADAVFAAMPPQVDRGILDALRAGFGRQSPMALHWDRDTSEGEPTIAHRVDDQGDWIHVFVTAPDGRQFL